MCGIAGWIDPKGGLDPSVIERQLDFLLHRGPDSYGIHRGSAGVVGQTRLAVIDLVTGDPPIANEDGSVGVALNGEIYNYRRLRKDLEQEGHRFATQGDTEVLAHLAESLDAVALARALDGMFAFAVWKERSETLVLGRDPVGKKPLYYWTDGRRLVFASEIKALLVHPDVPAELDPSAIPAYLTFGYVPTPGTFFSGIRSVPPGHVLEVRAGSDPALTAYWEPRVPGAHAVSPLDVSLDEAAAGTLDLLTAAVERRLIADVPLGAFLSGGIDSSAVVALMARGSASPVKTFTIGFEGAKGYDERPHARNIADRFKTDHTEFVVRPHAVDLVETLAETYDQPFGDSSAIPTYLLSELTRQHVTVALAGDGGDELFAGYERFRAALWAERFGSLPTPARRMLRGAVGRVPRTAFRGRAGSLQRFAGAADLGLPDALATWVGLTSSTDREALGITSRESLEDYGRVWARSSGAAPLHRLLHLNMQTYLVDDLLVKVDRASMAHALEVRAPFLDRSLIEFALRLPPELQMRGLTLKRVLKRALRGVLPNEVLDRRKRGFGVPLDSWFRTDLGSYVRSVLGRSARVRGHVDGAGLDGVIARHEAGRADHGQLLWALLMLEVFLQKHEW